MGRVGQTVVPQNSFFSSLPFVSFPSPSSGWLCYRYYYYLPRFNHSCLCDHPAGGTLCNFLKAEDLGLCDSFFLDAQWPRSAAPPASKWSRSLPAFQLGLEVDRARIRAS